MTGRVGGVGGLALGYRGAALELTAAPHTVCEMIPKDSGSPFSARARSTRVS
jgi:hypothetical protein